MKKVRIKQSDNLKVFFSSDFHFNHNNLCLGSTKWTKTPKPYAEMSKQERIDFSLENGVRPFANVNEMNDVLVQNINDTVGPDDVLFHLGDWSFREPLKTRDRLVCQNIYCIYGNHDRDLNEMKDRLVVYPTPAIELEVDGQLICLSHYKHLVWNKRHHGSWHLYGHSHSNFEHVKVGRSMDVGVDNAFRLLGDYRPFSFEEIKERIGSVDINHFSINGREYDVRDHHDRE